MNVTITNYGFGCHPRLARAVVQNMARAMKEWRLTGGSSAAAFALCEVASVVKSGAVCGGVWSLWTDNDDPDECGRCRERGEI